MRVLVTFCSPIWQDIIICSNKVIPEVLRQKATRAWQVVSVGLSSRFMQIILRKLGRAWLFPQRTILFSHLVLLKTVFLGTDPAWLDQIMWWGFSKQIKNKVTGEKKKFSSSGPKTTQQQKRWWISQNTWLSLSLGELGRKSGDLRTVGNTNRPRKSFSRESTSCCALFKYSQLASDMVTFFQIFWYYYGTFEIETKMRQNIWIVELQYAFLPLSLAFSET